MVAMDPFAAARAWFAARGMTPFAFQEDVWAAYCARPIAASSTRRPAWARRSPRRCRRSRSAREGAADAPPPLTLLWITPLRALAADTGLALTRCRGRAAPALDRRRAHRRHRRRRARAQGKRLPTVLVTTPESLTLFLARADWRERFAHLAAVVVDEWHELLSTKRGVQTELALARLPACVPELRVWGLSATLANLDTALAALVGVGAQRTRRSSSRDSTPRRS